MKKTSVILGLLFVSVLAPFVSVNAQEAKIDRIEQRLEALEKSNSIGRTELRGQIQFVTATYDVDKDIDSSKRPNLEGGAHFRRVRYDARTNLSGGFSSRLQLEFADEELGLKNVHIDYNFRDAQIRIGNTKVPQSHEYIMSSSDIHFVQRSLANEAFNVGRKAGLDLQGHVEEKFTYHTGVYTDASGARDSDERSPVYSAIRLTGVPFQDGANFLHLGGHFIHSTGEIGPRFRSGPESRVSRIRPIDTSSLSGSHKVHRYGGELMTFFKDWRFTYEYMGATVQERDASFSGHLFEAAANLTGEGREYDFSSGTLDGLEPTRPWSEGGLGALELALRASWIDLNDSSTDSQGVFGGKGMSMAANLAWIPVKNMLFAAEVGRLDLEQVNGLADQEIGQYQLKVQVLF